MPVQPKNAQRQRDMEQFLRECQAFTLLKQQGVITREVWQEWLRREYDIPIPVPIDLEVPDMRDLTDHLSDRLQQMVDKRLEEIFTLMEEEDSLRVGAMIEAEQAPNGAVQTPPEPVQPNGDEDDDDVISEEDIAALAEGDE